MKTLTLDQVITQVCAVTQGMETIADSTAGRIELAFHDVDAQPEDIASALTEALPDWFDALHVRGEAFAWAVINRHQAEIVAYVTTEQAKAYIARQQAAA